MRRIFVGKTHRSNVPLKRAHWHSARTERRGRFAHGWFWMQDQDLHYRRQSVDHLPGRSVCALPRATGWLTADKSHVRWLLEEHRDRLSPRRAQWLAEKLNLRGMTGNGTA